MKHCANSVETTARRLAKAVAIDFWGVEDDDGIMYDNNETIINLTEAKESYRTGHIQQSNCNKIYPSLGQTTIEQRRRM